jgi:hypothetical protein
MGGNVLISSPSVKTLGSAKRVKPLHGNSVIDQKRKDTHELLISNQYIVTVTKAHDQLANHQLDVESQ